jgi:hypothetical protein
MNKTSVQTAPAPAPAKPVSTGEREADPETAPRRGPGLGRKVLQAVASLRLTVALFVLALLLVFVGTLAQVFQSNYSVTNGYFRSFYVWVPWQLFAHFGRVFFQNWVPADVHVDGAFPFPGGRTIGFLLLANLLAAHAVRFKLSWKRAGVVTLHAGLVALMLGELVTSLLAVEGHMSIWAKGSSNYTEASTAVELAIVTPAGEKEDDVVVVSGKALRRGKDVALPDLPFDVKVEHYYGNAVVTKSAPGPAANPATAGVGLSAGVEEIREGSGTDTEQRIDTPAAYVTFAEKSTAKKLATFLVSTRLNPQKFEAGGKTYDVSLRNERTYRPYTVELLQFDHKKYMGTSTPKDFRSRVRLTDPARHEDRTVEIYMNHPLVYQGETFYQQSFMPGDTGTILQVVRNPGWPLPYLSCGLVTLGMAVHFGIHLNGFLRRRAAA